VKIVSPSFEILAMTPEPLQLLELAGRTCYKSEDKISPGSADEFIKKLVNKGHHSVIEHASITVKFVCDRGVSHELVRHRLASFSQESTRYANYSHERFGSEITVIRPLFWPPDTPEYNQWYEAMAAAEKAYISLVKKMKASPEQARSVLPNSLKTEIIMTANLREWRHVLELRCSARSHPQMRELMLPLLAELNRRLPAVFGDIYKKYEAAVAEMEQTIARLDRH